MFIAIIMTWQNNIFTYELKYYIVLLKKELIQVANTTNINVRVDAVVKHQAETLFAELGMNLSTAMNLFLRSAVRYGGIPFDLRISQKPLGLEAMSKPQVDAKLEAGFRSIKAGRGRSAEEFFDDLEREFDFEKIQS